MAELPKAYLPADAEARWYPYWYQHHLYDARPNADRPPYTIVIPPPNITGMLTLGHILNNTLQDLYIRWHRMRGYEACWIPGTDHAGIATQTKVVEDLAKQGINYRDLGREGFIEKVWQWREKYGSIILSQLRALGVSVDWRRERFTMDPGLNEAVREVFVRLFESGLIYRGKKIVNWSPKAQTTLSDEEVNHREVQDKMYTLRYHLADGSGTVLVSTARPETIYGDVAVAVNPNDPRYQHMIGMTVTVPFAGQQVAIIADEYADPEFGTGAVKITPAHDPNDFEVGLRHNLPMPNTINPDGTMNDLAGPLAGMDRFDARRAVVERLQELDLIERVEEYTHSVGFSERGGEQIEPYLSDQWFVSMKSLAEPALRAVREGFITVSPEHWVKTYEHWMTNIRDWPISRQLWWGHRIPVYYLEDGRYTAARNQEEAWQKLGVPAGTPMRQDEDVLDTWFSSWLWPFSVHGWGSSSRNEQDLRYFYPTDLLITGPDIIFFWVARMIMAGLEFMQGEPKSDGMPRTEMKDLIPFKHVYFTSIIRDAKGRKMSKSLGNSPDPLDVIGEYGADALRFTIVYIAPAGQDVRFGTEMVELGRNFANKIWNAGRFLLMKRDEAFPGTEGGKAGYADSLLELQPISSSDRWILSRFHSTLASVESALSGYRINEYSKILYDFVWRDFCDWYVELLKNELAMAGDPARARVMMQFALGLYDQILRMVHPIMPFVTEELWQNLAPRGVGESISIVPFPGHEPALISPLVEREFAVLQESVEAVRRMRSEAAIPPSKSVNLTVKADGEESLLILNDTAELLRRMARIEDLLIDLEATKPPLSKTEVVLGNEIHLHLEGVIDVAKEREKTEKEMARLVGQIRATESKLQNEKFVANAPTDVVDTERTKLKSFQETFEKLQETLKQYA
jgi:valyl-tRNA synthetase